MSLNKEIPEVMIVDGMRTAIGRMGGTLSPFRPEELAAIALKGLIEKTKIDPAIVDEVMIGHACTNNSAVNIARWAVLKAGFPDHGSRADGGASVRIGITDSQYGGAVHIGRRE